jgi:nucleoside-diphosphate-sugar epimerase
LKNNYGAFNISTNDTFRTIDLFNLIQQVIGDKLKSKIVNESSLEIKNQLMDSSLLINETGWQPVFNLNDSIHEIVHWYLNNI